MALLKFMRGEHTNLDKQALCDGRIWFCTDDGTLHVDYKDTDSSLQRKQAEVDSTKILELVYPVGSIYMSAISVSPGTLFGFGTWEQIEDRFLLAAGTTYENGATGGNSEVALQKANAPYSAFGMQFHNSTTGTPLASVWSASDITNVNKIKPGYRDGGNYSASTSESIGSFTYNNGGTSEPFSILPPYLAVYMWKRIA